MLKAIFNLKDGDTLKGSSVLLDGLKSTEADSFQWRVLGVQEHTPDKFNIWGPNEPATKVDELVAGKYYIELTVKNAEGSDVLGVHVTIEI